MFSMTTRKADPAQLRNSSAPSSRRTTHSAKIIGAAAIALLAAGNTIANAAENPARLAQEQHACAVVLGLDPTGRRYDASEGNQTTPAAPPKVMPSRQIKQCSVPEPPRRTGVQSRSDRKSGSPITSKAGAR